MDDSISSLGSAAFRALAVVGTLLLGPADAAEPVIHGRSFDRFQFDAVVNRGLWGEGRIAYSRQDDPFGSGDVDVAAAGPRVAYGWRFVEGGLLVPSVYVHSDQRSDESGIGDIHLYGKILPLDLDVARAGLGLDVSVPSGDEDKGLGAGEAGFTPFVTAAVRGGPVDVRGHVGYQAFVDSEEDFNGDDFPPDSVVFGVGVFLDIAEIAIGRLELIGQHFDRGGSSTALALEPGIDFRIPARRVSIWLRPTGAVGLTDETFDWGLGFAIAVSWTPQGQ
jgi:hypothetical protein